MSEGSGLLILDPGLWTTIQDQGRVGYREWGVPVGGSFDRRSAGMANALVGNSSEEAVIELTLRGGVYEAEARLGLALAGAPMEAWIESETTDVPVRRLAPPQSFAMRRGDRLVLGRAIRGARAYLAARGGFRTPLRLGSRSTEVGLKAGVRLPACEGSVASRRPGEMPRCAIDRGPFRIIEGPDAGDLNGHELWSFASFRVGSRSDRMGLRLEGDPVTTRSRAGRLSAPVAPGAVQVAGDRLIILGVAGGTMGGYPHVAHVITADLDRLGQLRPGDPVQFRRVNLAEARVLDRADRRSSNQTLERLRIMAGDRIAED